MNVFLSSAVLGIRNKFAVLPVHLWIIQLLVTSLFSTAFFAVMADSISNPDITIRYVVLGNVIQSIASTTLYSVADMPGVEKHTGTLSPLMQTPASLFTIFLGMSVINIISGLISATMSLFFAVTVFGIDLGGADFASAAVTIILTTLSLTGFGMMIGSVGIRFRTSVIIANLAAYIGLLICGVNFPISYFPEWVQMVANALPLTYGVDAMRLSADGAGISEILPDLSTMVLLGMIYFIISALLFRLFEKKARSTGSFETF